jgi:hypothetical protein
MEGAAVIGRPSIGIAGVPNDIIAGAIVREHLQNDSITPFRLV